MPAPESLHPLRDDGSEVDATFTLDTQSIFRITFRHKAGGRGSPRAVNSDYHEGLELLLGRLSLIGAELLDIQVDSSVARALAPRDRRIDLPLPLRLDAATDVAALRLDITRALKPVARRASAKQGGGNDQKTIVLSVELDAPTSFDVLRKLLVDGRGLQTPA